MKPTKIETIPFLLTPQAATRTLENAAHAAFGVSGTAKLLLSRFLHRFNIPYDPPLKCIAFRPLLVPTWRVDLRLCARGVLGEVGMQFMLTATDASLPGFKLPPLDQLAMTAPWETEPVKFDPEVHLNQHGEAVGQLPFTHSPLNFLATLAALPRLNAQKNGISFDPTSIKTQLFAAYPLYLPIYLGEFVEDSDEARHVTTVAYASLAKTAFAIYPTFLESPSWMPNSEGLEISLGGMPVDLDKPPEPDALRKLAPQLNQLLVEGKTLSTRDPVSPEEIETNPRVMAYSEHAFENREYIKAHEELVSIEALMKKIESIPDSVKAVSVSLKGIKIGDGPSWKVLMKKKLFQAQKRVEVTKPQWMDELQAKTAADAAARKSANGRPSNQTAYFSMPTKTQALVLDNVGAEFQLRDIQVDDPLEDEVLVRMISSGICHSDLGVQNGNIGLGPVFPCILGHEGAGVIAKLGAGVTGLEVGDQVLLSFNFCGKCRICNLGRPASCTAWGGLNFGFMRSDGGLNVGVQSNGEPVRGVFFGQSSFAGYTLASPRSCVKVAKDVDITYLGPLGCGIQTGAGTVLNVLKPKVSDRVAIWGLGGVGISALLATKALGVKTIIAIDLLSSRLDLALELGASHAINGADKDILEQIAKITDGDMLDYVVEATGIVPCMRMAWDSLAIFGTLAQIGMPKDGTEAPIQVVPGVAMQKTWLGILEGDAYPPEFIPKLVEMVAAGTMPVEKISRLFPISKFQDAIDAMKQGTVMKPILVF